MPVVGTDVTKVLFPSVPLRREFRLTGKVNADATDNWACDCPDS